MEGCKHCMEATPLHYKLALWCAERGIDIQEVTIGYVDGVLYYPLKEHDEALLKANGRKAPSYVLDTEHKTYILPTLSATPFEAFTALIERSV